MYFKQTNTIQFYYSLLLCMLSFIIKHTTYLNTLEQHMLNYPGIGSLSRSSGDAAGGSGRRAALLYIYIYIYVCMYIYIYISIHTSLYIYTLYTYTKYLNRESSAEARPRVPPGQGPLGDNTWHPQPLLRTLFA